MSSLFFYLLGSLLCMIIIKLINKDLYSPAPVGAILSLIFLSWMGMIVYIIIVLFATDYVPNLYQKLVTYFKIKEFFFKIEEFFNT